MFDFLTRDMLAVIWFFLWCIIWGVYFMVDSFSLGAGLLVPFIATDKVQRIQIQRSVGPFWGGNEVWLVLAAGGTFAAFPLVFSKMFTFLHLPMMLLFIGLVARGISVEYLHKDDNPQIQEALTWGWFVGSLLISLVLGVAFANFFKGLEITSGGVYKGTLLGLFGPYALIDGALFVLMSVTSGALWINVKTEGDIAEKAGDLAKKSTLYCTCTCSGISGIFLCWYRRFYNQLFSHASSVLIASSCDSGSCPCCVLCKKRPGVPGLLQQSLGASFRCSKRACKYLSLHA
jgi:cytochrome d ubiquinol oxidase subunit II